MSVTDFVIPIIAVTVLCAGWIGVQLIARRLKIKNLLEHRPTPCGGCEDETTCDRASCRTTPDAAGSSGLKIQGSL